MKEWITTEEQQTEALAAQVGARLRAGDAIAYRGGLGAGKTAFTRGLAQGLGIRADVSSPTFALVHEYRDGDKVLYHFDMYRINDFDALYDTGFFDYLDGAGILAIEWSEQIENALPDSTITITLERMDDNTRRITIEGGGERFADIGG